MRHRAQIHYMLFCCDTYTAVTDTGVMYPQMLLLFYCHITYHKVIYLPVMTSSLVCKTGEGCLASLKIIKCSADPCGFTALHV